VRLVPRVKSPKSPKVKGLPFVIAVSDSYLQSEYIAARLTRARFSVPPYWSKPALWVYIGGQILALFHWARVSKSQSSRGAGNLPSEMKVDDSLVYCDYNASCLIQGQGQKAPSCLNLVNIGGRIGLTFIHDYFQPRVEISKDL